MRLWSLWSLSSKFISRSDPHSFFAGEFQCSSVLKFPCLFDYYLHSCIFVCVCICVQVHTTYTHTPIFIPMHMSAFTCLIYAGRIIIYLSTYHYLYLPINKHTNPLNGKLMIPEFHSCCRQIYSYIMLIIYIQAWPFWVCMYTYIYR